MSRYLRLAFLLLGVLCLARMTLPAPIVGAPNATDWWVDAAHGDDMNDGLSAATPFLTIQAAADMARAGDTVHILPGVYRESVVPVRSGSAQQPIRYVSENGPHTAVLRGSQPSTALTWTRMTQNTIGLPSKVDPTKLYYTDLTEWGLVAPPKFLVQMDALNVDVVARLPISREPDWQVTTMWKYHEFWWAADGGTAPASCTPTPSDPNCDQAVSSMEYLTDRTTDTAPAGIEPGNLTTLGNLNGATLVAMDNVSGHYVYRRRITSHDRTTGRIKFTPLAGAEGRYKIGWGTKYYLENSPALLDKPGEWWYDQNTQRLYLWPPTSNSPALQPLEIARLEVGFDLSNRSYIILDGLKIEFFNENAVEISNSSRQRAYGDEVHNALIRYVNRGICIDQGVSTSSVNVTKYFVLADSEVAYIDSLAIYLNYWWENNNDPNSFSYPGISYTTIRNNELHHLGFRATSDNAVGSMILYPDHVRIEGNHIYNVAHNGLQFAYSLVRSDDDIVTPDEVRIGNILVKDNIFESACQLTTDCGALKFWGNTPRKHLAKDVLITGNVFRDTFGWTSISEKRGLWSLGTVQGMGGMGLYVDMASGFHVYRNISYNNGHAGFNFSGVWDTGDLVYYNNIAANNLYGFYFTAQNLTPDYDAQIEFLHNIIINNEAYGVLLGDAGGMLDHLDAALFDRNIYFGNGWGETIWKGGDMAMYRGAYPNKYYQTLTHIRENTPWEDHGVDNDPYFRTYVLTDHDRHDDSWPNFHITAASVNILDKGRATLPASLNQLLTTFAVEDFKDGGFFDIGRYELENFILVATVPSQQISAGERAIYHLRLIPDYTAFPVTLQVLSPPAPLSLSLSPATVTGGEWATLAVTSTHATTPKPGQWYTLSVIANGDGISKTKTLRLLVGGEQHFIPIVLK